MKIWTWFLNGHLPIFFAAVTYLDRLLPRKIISLFSFLPNSVIDFSLAMWDENVVMTIPELWLSVVKKTSSSNPLAIFSEGVFLSSGA